MLNDYINKLINNTTNINYIMVGLGNKEYISQYIFDKLFLYLKEKQVNKDIEYSSYYLYKNNNIILHLNTNSSNCYIDHLKYFNKVDYNNYNLYFQSYNRIKQNNDKLESSYKYDSIENVENILFDYKNNKIELIKNNNKYYIKIIITKYTISANIQNLLNIIINIA